MQATNLLQNAYKKFRAIFGAKILFSCFVNLPMFVGLLYMLQIYDRAGIKTDRMML
jgi:ABC-type protease/lipase transport system fused ATPase/permease subunit